MVGPEFGQDGLLRCHRGNVLAAAVLLALFAAGCGGGEHGDDTARIADLRSRQARSAAAEAGLDADVQDLLARAARAPAATFGATYASGADRLVVHQRPPRRRVDVVVAGRSQEAVVSDADGAVHCERRAADDDRWRCAPTAAADTTLGAFSPELVARTVEALRDAAPGFRTTVVEQRLAQVRARCLVTTPVADDGASSRLCVAPDGVPLLVDRGDGSPILRAVRYEPSATAGDVARPDGR